MNGLQVLSTTMADGLVIPNVIQVWLSPHLWFIDTSSSSPTESSKAESPEAWHCTPQSTERSCSALQNHSQRNYKVNFFLQIYVHFLTLQKVGIAFNLSDTFVFIYLIKSPLEKENGPLSGYLLAECEVLPNRESPCLKTAWIPSFCLIEDHPGTIKIQF